MPGADLASPRRNEAGQHEPQDPFATPASQAIQAPAPCAHLPYSPRSAQRAAYSDPRDIAYDRTPTAYYKSSSFSSQGSGLMTPVSSMDLEKSSTTQESPPRHQRDPEKAIHPTRHHPRQTNNMGDNISMSYSEDDGDADGRRLQEDKAINILLFLSGPCAVLSTLNTVWTCIALLITLLSQPVRLCARRPSFGQQLSGLLGPALNLQLRRIYTPLPPHANEDGSYHAGTLVAVHLLSPFLSLGMMFLAWVLAVYWVSSAVVGDPAGLDKRDDGRETVLGLRKWWESYLMRSVREQ
ncbi:hypothetical protein LTR53_006862 [Teratosphaeriaceae sp. CCFEE 6253]|nr:hypothetical protein LTR53_006862 [Teratosphaeriaceae sp. CCFEE 6253]